jgi:hypothetical protein
MVNSIPPVVPRSLPLDPNKPPKGQPDDKQPLPKKPHHFSKETIQSLQELGDILVKIHRRLVSEGHTICNGNISKNTKSRVINGHNDHN